MEAASNMLDRSVCTTVQSLLPRFRPQTPPKQGPRLAASEADGSGSLPRGRDRGRELMAEKMHFCSKCTEM